MYGYSGRGDLDIAPEFQRAAAEGVRFHWATAALPNTQAPPAFVSSQENYATDLSKADVNRNKLYELARGMARHASEDQTKPEGMVSGRSAGVEHGANSHAAGAARFIVGICHWRSVASCATSRSGAKEQYPDARPRIISDNGPQFIAKYFKEFIRISGMTHARTSPFYPQSNGKIERWHKSLKGECIRPGTPLSLGDARRLVQGYVDHYNNVRLNSPTGTSPRRTCSPGDGRKSTRSATESWRRRESNGIFIASRPLDE